MKYYWKKSRNNFFPLTVEYFYASFNIFKRHSTFSWPEKKIKETRFYSFEKSENLSPPSSQGILRDCIFEEINDISARRLQRYIFPPLNWKTCLHPRRLNKNPASKVIRKVDWHRLKKKKKFILKDRNSEREEKKIPVFKTNFKNEWSNRSNMRWIFYFVTEMNYLLNEQF